MKSSRSGFTIVEILVTLVVMASLVALGTYAVGTMLAQARDRERESDVKIIANGLEVRYNDGNSVIISDGNTPKTEGNAGSYPGVNEMFHMDGFSRTGWTPKFVYGGYRSKVLKGTNVDAFRSPSGDGYVMECIYACSPATANDQTRINTLLAAGNDRYVYAPADAAGNVCCCGNCVKYTLYWRSEIDGQIKTLKSKHR